MSKVLITEQYLEDIADAIRIKNDTEDTYTPADMSQAIIDIPGGARLTEKTVTENGIYYADDDDYDGYSSVNVAVSGGGGGVALLTEQEWDELTTQEKRAYGLVAIQESISGYIRGTLVNGEDYIPAPVEILSHITRNDNQGYQYTADRSRVLIVINSEEIHETTNVSLISTITTTGTVISTDTKYRNTASAPLMCGSFTISIISVEAGDTINFYNDGRNNTTQSHLIFKADIFDLIDYVYWQDWRDNEWNSNNYTVQNLTGDDYLAFCIQTANGKGIGVSIASDGDVTTISDGSDSTGSLWTYSVAFIRGASYVRFTTNNVTFYVGNQIALYKISENE